MLSLQGFSSVNTNDSNHSKTNVHLISSSEKVVELVFSTVDFQSETVKLTNSEAIVIRLENGSAILEAGAPDLNKLTASVIIPASEKMNIEIVSSEYYDVENVQVAPSKGNLYRNQNPADVPFFYGASYKVDAFYPGKLAELRKPYILRDFRGQTVVAYPLQYNPITKVLRVYTSIHVKLVNSNEKGENIITNGNPKKTDAEFNRIYKQQFLNFDASKYTSVGESGNMLVVCPAKYLEAIKPLVEWKNKRGIATELVEFASATTGISATALKNYINTYYLEKGLTFLLLIGDSEDIPSLYASGDSDVAYSYVSGNDSYPEFFVGRFSASNQLHVQTQVEKTITYERDLDETATWLSNGLGMASAEGGNGTGDDGESDKQHMEKVKADLLSFTYENITSAYDPGATAAQVTNAINAGVGIINYVGHGSDLSWGTSGFSVSNINKLTNTNRWPFIFDVACVNGNFHGQTCFAEAFMQAYKNDEPTGAVAIIASTINQAWNPPMDAQDEMVDILIESYENNVKRTFGGIAYNGCLHMNDEYGSEGDEMTDTWTTFGDPSLLVRTGIPVAMQVSHPEELLIGMLAFEVACNTEGALVNLSNQGVLKASSEVKNGVALLEFEPFTDIADLDVVITGFNKITYQSVIRVIPAAGPYISVSSCKINDKFGNNNGSLENNEDAFIEVQIKNVGVEAAGNVISKLSSTDEYVQITNASHHFGTIEAGDLAGNSSFSIHLAENLPNQHPVDFLVTFTDSLENSWTREMSFTINSPVLVMGEAVLSEDGSFGDGNNKLEPGETATLNLEVFNNGNNSSSPMKIKWNLESPYAIVDNALTPVAPIDAGESTIISIKVTAHTSAPQGTKVAINYDWSTADTLQNIIQTVIGQSPSLEIGTASTVKYNYPFYNYYRSNKTQIIYQASEFSSGTHLINELAFNLASFTTNSKDRNLSNYVIKLGTTAANEFGTSYLEFENSDTVLFMESFELPDTKGWFKIAIDPYTYATSDGNLVVEIYWGINESYCGSTDRTSVYCTETTVPKVAYGYADVEYPANFDGTSKTRPNIQFGFIDQNLIQDTLTIEVVDESMIPISEALVTIGSQILMTDTIGLVYYYLSHGEYPVNLSKDLHQPMDTMAILNDTVKWATLLLPAYENLYQAQFIVSNGTTPIEGAVVTCKNQVLITNPNGVALFDKLPPATYSYCITKAGYDTVSQEIVVTENVSIPVTLNAIPVYTATFEITEAGTPLADVNVLFNKEWAISQSNGNALFTNIASGSNLIYYIEKWGYYSVTDTIEISQNITIPVALNAIPDVLVHVTNKFGNMDKAKVTFQNQTDYTNSEGIAKFADIVSGENQTILIESQGYYAETTQIGVVDQDQILDSYLFKKSDLKIRVTDANQAIIGAVVKIGTLEKTTDSLGTVEFLSNTEATNQVLTIVQEGYYTIESQISFVKDVDLDTTIVIEMIPDLEFIVTWKGEAAAGALLALNGTTLFSDEEGKIKITDLMKGTYAYSIEKAGFYSLNQSITMASADVLLPIELSAIPDVNFIITHNGIPESGVSVEISAKKINTSATGNSLFVDLPAGTYAYTVSKVGFDTITNELVVANVDLVISLDITYVSAPSIDASTIQIYPNPSNGKLIIEVPTNGEFTKLELFNEIGLLVYTQNNLQRSTSLDLDHLSKGIYFISLSGESRKILLKQIIE